MGQQPNIELEISALPRPVPHPAPARPWKPTRPGEITTPEAMPWGGAFGTIGPDSGYALLLIRQRAIELGDGEDPHGAEQVLAAIATARASHFGRAPIGEDVDIAEILSGLDSAGIPGPIADHLVALRMEQFAGAGHDYQTVRAVVASIPRDLLIDNPESLRRRVAAGELPET